MADADGAQLPLLWPDHAMLVCMCVCVCVCVCALARMHARILVPVFGTQHGAVHTVGLNESMWKKQ